MEERRVALKIQRPDYPREAMNEIALHRALKRQHGQSQPGIIRLLEAFVFRGCITMTFERHGCGLDTILRSRPMELGTIKTITLQVIHALRLLHAAGYTHTDVKPGNILFDPGTRAVKLIDLGGASSELRQGSRLGTHHYRAPEVILGAPLGPAIDVWGLGCTVWGMLTGQRLFDPRVAASKKYQEFSKEEDGETSPAGANGDPDRQEEEVSPQAGEVWGGKYRLEETIGDGGFGTVWSAAVVSEQFLDESHETFWSHTQQLEASDPPLSPIEEQDHAWQEEKGVHDLPDLVLNYELLLLMQNCCGRIPRSLIESGLYRRNYFQPDGTLRFDPLIEPRPFSDALRERRSMAPGEAEAVHDLLSGLLHPDPALRLGLDACLQHPWLASVRLQPA